MEYMMIDLQLFAEGAGAAAAAPGAETGPVAGDAGAKDPTTGDSAAANRGEEAAKTYTEDDVQRMIRDRVKNLNSKLKAAEEREAKLRPAFDRLARKYKADGEDALVNAILGDKTIYEDEALERGVTPEQIEAEVARDQAEARIKALEAEIGKNAVMEQWRGEEEALKRVYPNFDLAEESKNPEFMSLISSPYISLKTAYEAIHHDDLYRQAMGYAHHQGQKEGEQKVAASVAANARRPVESATAPSAGTPTPGIQFTTKAQRDDIARRVANGEWIVL